jgi:fatty-acid desaturase
MSVAREVEGAAGTVGPGRVLGLAALSKLATPTASQPLRIAWIDAIGLATVHILALLAFVPWFFSWTGVIVAFVGLYVFGTLGISLCFHRLLTHRAFVCPRWLEHSLAILGLCCLQDTPARWVAIHRQHHHHADDQPDPHSPLVHFLWAHVGWMIIRSRDTTRLRVVSRYAKDILRDPFYARLEQNFFWAWLVLLSWCGFFAVGFLAELLCGGSAMDALQFGLSILVWGVFVRTVLVWHVTWSINSVTHLWGYRNYETDDSSRNNFVIGIISNGEGWHNNHHAYPQSARHGHLWWEFDLTWLAIRLLAALGLVRDVITPPSTAWPQRVIPVANAVPASAPVAPPPPAPGSSPRSAA